MKPIQNIRQLQSEISNNSELKQAFKDDPVKAIQEVHDNNPPLPDTFIYRIIVGSLGLSILMVIVAVVLLQYKYGIDQDVPTIFTAIASGAIGALAGLLAPSPRNGG